MSLIKNIALVGLAVFVFSSGGAFSQAPPNGGLVLPALGQFSDTDSAQTSSSHKVKAGAVHHKNDTKNGGNKDSGDSSAVVNRY